MKVIDNQNYNMWSSAPMSIVDMMLENITPLAKLEEMDARSAIIAAISDHKDRAYTGQRDTTGRAQRGDFAATATSTTIDLSRVLIRATGSI